MRLILLILSIAISTACTTKFRDVEGDGDADAASEVDSGDQDASDDAGELPTDPSAEEPTTCTSGDECVDQHGPGFMCCDGLCMDTMSDERNCGDCGNACAYGRLCCDGSCIDPDVDASHCGTCDNACMYGEVCCGGDCCPEHACCAGGCCGEGLSCCDDACVNLGSDVDHCGRCEIACEPGEACMDGACHFCRVSILWSGDMCYIGGATETLGKYSYLGRLAPAADGRLDHPPDFMADDYNVPSFGIYALDLLPSDYGFSSERNYLTRITFLDRNAEVVGAVDDLPSPPRAIMAFDAFPVVIDDHAYLAYTGLQHEAGQGDAYIVKRVDFGVSEFFLDLHQNSSSDTVPAAPGWELPWPNEFGSSMAAVDDPGPGNFWSILAGGAVRLTPGRRATVRGLGPISGVWTLGGPEGDESVVTHVAYGPDLDGDPRLYALVDHRYNATSFFIVELRCFDLTDPSLSTECDGWMGGISLGSSGVDNFGSGLAVSNDGRIVFAISASLDVIRVGAVNPNGSVITDFGGDGLAELSTNTDLHARIQRILLDRNGYIFLVGYQASDSPTSNYQKTPTVWKLAPGGYYSMPFCGSGRCDYGEGIYSDGLWLCDGTMLLRKYLDPWGPSVDNFADDRVCLSRIDPVTGGTL